VRIEMTTHITRRAMREPPPLDNHWLWLAGGLCYAFAVPFVFAELLELPRDMYYGVYVAAVGALLYAWLHATRKSALELLRRRWPLGGRPWLRPRRVPGAHGPAYGGCNVEA
jgi:hypothetical protein